MDQVSLSLAASSTDSVELRPQEVARRETVIRLQLGTAALVWNASEPHGVVRPFQARHVMHLHVLRTSRVAEHVPRPAR